MDASPTKFPGAMDTARMIADGRLTAEQAVRDRLDLIAAREAEVQAWVHIDEAGALDAARALDAGPRIGPLHGVPLAVKDIFAADGLPWRCGSPIWADRVARFDAGSVALARAAGGIILGKSETTEFAGYTPTRTRNPVDLSRTPGGSSSGSAAAVACGMVPLAFGTQTSGSIIRPASYCGVVGYKPSLDTVEPGGVAPLARSFDTIGLFARTVRDVAFGISALTGLDLQPDATADPPKLPIYRSAAWSEADPALISAWGAFETRLGDRMAEHSFDPGIESRLLDAPALHARIMAAEAAEALAHEHHRFAHLLSPALRDMLDEGRAMTGDQKDLDRRDMRDLRSRIDALVPRRGVWLTPSATGPAPAYDAGTGSPAFNRIWSLLGLPCCSVPILQDSDRMPIGVQVVGAIGNDLGVLTVAEWLMSRTGPMS